MTGKQPLQKTERLTMILCIAGAGASLAVVGLSEYFQLNRSYLGIAAFAGFMIYLVSRKYLTEQAANEEAGQMQGWRRSPNVFALLLAVFTALLTSSILHLHNLAGYQRDLLYFILFFSAVLAVLVQLFLLDIHPERRKRLLLVQIFLLGLSYKASAYFLYPSLSGNDPFYHQRLVDQYLSTGQFPREEFYILFPIFHFLTAAMAKGGLVDVKTAFFYTSILQSLSLLLVYPVGKRVFGARAGLIAVLLLTLSDYQILWGVQVIPMTLGIVLYTVCLMGLYFLQDGPENRNGWVILIAVLGLVMVFTHNLSSLILLTSLFLVFAANIIMHFFQGSKNKFQTVGLSLFLIIAIATITYWGGISEKPEITFFQRVVASIVASLNEAKLGNTEMVSLAYSMGLWETTVLDAGWVLLLFFMIPGLLATLFKKEQAFSFAVLSVGLLFITYGTAVTGARHILSARWFAFVYIFCALFAGFALDRWMRKSESETRKQSVFRTIFQAAISMILIVLVFAMATSPVRSNTDSPLYLGNLSPRPGFYESELVGMEYFLEHNQGESATSSKTRRYVNQGTVIDPRDEKTYANIPRLLIRQYDYEKGFFIPYPQYQLTDNVMPTTEYLEYLERFCKRSYDNGEVYIYNCVVDETMVQ